MTRSVETVVDEFFEPRHNVAQWSAERLAPERPVLAKMHVSVQDVIRYHLRDRTIRFASSLVEIPQPERVQAAH